jgi:hypothetical protein
MPHWGIVASPVVMQPFSGEPEISVWVVLPCYGQGAESEQATLLGATGRLRQQQGYL